MKILLTGATGYIGSHCAVHMIRLGYEIVIFDNLSNSSADVLSSIETITGVRPAFVKGDIRKSEDLHDVFSNHEMAGVIHFAGLKSVGESCIKPFQYYENNVVGTSNLLQAMAHFGVSDIIFSSSATVYDTIKAEPPFVESDLLHPNNPYGSTKYIIERMLEDVALQLGFRAISLRYFNPIGADESGLLGEHPEGTPNNLLPILFDVVASRREKLSVFGNDYDTPDGTGVRDYIDVMDLVAAHTDAMTYMQKKGGGFYDVFNLGVGKGKSVLEMIQAVEKITGHRILYDVVGRRSGDTAVLVSNPQKANDILGWKATTDIADSIAHSWKFVQKLYQIR